MDPFLKTTRLLLLCALSLAFTSACVETKTDEGYCPGCTADAAADSAALDGGAATGGAGGTGGDASGSSGSSGDGGEIPDGSSGSSGKDANGDAGEDAASAGDGGNSELCYTNSDCTDPAAARCHTESGACLPCDRDQHCAHLPATPNCHASQGLCVQCTRYDHCPDSACNLQAHQCIACVLEDSTSIGCQPPLAVCKPGPAPADNACVQCISVEHCGDNQPICQDNACRGCLTHQECDFTAGVCRAETGRCLSQSEVIYVSNASGSNCSDGGDGTISSPFCTLQVAIDAATPGRSTLLVSAGTYTQINVTDRNGLWVIGKADAEIKASSVDTPVIYLSGDTQLIVESMKIYYGSRTGAGVKCVSTISNPTLTVRSSELTGNAGGGIIATSCTLSVYDSTISDNGGTGVNASGGTLALFDSTISDNSAEGLSANDCEVTAERNSFTGNDGGGLSLKASDFTVINNLVATNGTDSSDYGGIHIASPGDTADLSFNTVVKNNSSGTESGIVCTLGNCNTVSVNSSILYENYAGDISDELTPNFCLIGDGEYSGGSDNLTDNPQFEGESNYHLSLQPRSPCIDTADPKSTVDRDLEHESRPQGGGFDMGAYEDG